MPVLSGKNALLDLLQQEGVDTIFGNPGTTELPLMDALSMDDRFRYILGLQEAAVVSMADGYAQGSRQLAVVNLHVTPGLGNAMGMLYNAQKSGAPILVTAGQQDQSFLITEPILHGDLPTLARPLVKWSYEVRALRDLPTAIHRAVKTALAPPTGPVFLSLPGDVLMENADIDLGAPSRLAARIRPDPDAVAEAAALLVAAERPVIMAGDAVVQSDAVAELVKFAELLGAPVYVEGVGNTASFPTAHALFRGSVNRVAPAFRNMLDQHDLLLSVGADLFTMSLPAQCPPISESVKVIHFDLDPWEIGKNIRTDVGFLGDPKLTLPELTSTLSLLMHDSQRGEFQSRRARYADAIGQERAALIARAQNAHSRSPISPLSLLRAIGDTLPSNAIVVEELLSSAEGVRQLIRSHDAQSYYGIRGGGIGWGIPASIGIKLAQPDRPVIALIGDGSAMFTFQAIWSAAHYRIPVMILIFNNSSYRILKQRIQAVGGNSANRYVGMDLVDPAIDFISLAQGLGVAAHRSSTVDETIELLRRHLNSERPVLIDVEIDRGVALAEEGHR